MNTSLWFLTLRSRFARSAVRKPQRCSYQVTEARGDHRAPQLPDSPAFGEPDVRHGRRLRRYFRLEPLVSRCGHIPGHTDSWEGGRMRRHRLAVAIPSTAIVVLWCMGIPGASAGAGARAQAASIARSAGAASGATRAVPTPKSKPTFDFTFRGSHLNKKIWDTCYPPSLRANYDGGCRNFGNPEEVEWYLPSQVKVSGGYLHLIAKREQTNGFTADGTPETYGCRSGMVTSFPGLQFEYGFVQVVANIPHSNGLWPALWLAAANGQHP